MDETFETIGASAYVGVPKQLKNKFQPKAKKEIFIGCSLRTKEFKIWLPKESKVVETLFPLRHVLQFIHIAEQWWTLLGILTLLVSRESAHEEMHDVDVNCPLYPMHLTSSWEIPREVNGLDNLDED